MMTLRNILIYNFSFIDTSIEDDTNNIEFIEKDAPQTDIVCL